MTNRIQVSQLYRYPVKSMRGEPLAASYVDERGVLGDRGYAVRDRESGMIASAKNPKKWGRMLELHAAYIEPPAIASPLPPIAIRFPDGTECSSNDSDVHERLSHELGFPVELIHDTPPNDKQLELVWAREALNPRDREAASKIGEQDGETLGRGRFGAMSPLDRYFDYSVIHVVTQTALDHLQSLEPAASFDPRRFRPNIVVTTDGSGFVENGWVGQSLVATAVRIRVIAPAVRCVMITLPQDELGRDRRTLRTIAQHNRLEIAGQGEGRWACAGVFCDVYAAGNLTLGDLLILDATPPDLPPALAF
jgi:uncharacterized protein YcbX